MNLGELVSELSAYGFDYLAQSRAEGYINDAYLIDVCEQEDWPFLEASTTGTAPMTISDLRDVEYVLDTTQETKLTPMARRNITDANSTLSEVGTPVYYYLTEGTILNAFPTSSTDKLMVRYWKVPSRLTTSDSPIIPGRFHSIIVNFAVARAYEDSDDYELAQSARATATDRLNVMRTSLLNPFRDGPSDFITVTNPADWG